MKGIKGKPVMKNKPNNKSRKRKRRLIPFDCLVDVASFFTLKEIQKFTSEIREFDSACRFNSIASKRRFIREMNVKLCWERLELLVIVGDDIKPLPQTEPPAAIIGIGNITIDFWGLERKDIERIKIFFSKIAPLLTERYRLNPNLHWLSKLESGQVLAALEAIPSEASFPVVSITDMPFDGRRRFVQRMLSTSAVKNTSWLSIYTEQLQIRDEYKQWLYGGNEAINTCNGNDTKPLRILHIVTRFLYHTIWRLIAEIVEDFNKAQSPNQKREFAFLYEHETVGESRLLELEARRPPYALTLPLYRENKHTGEAIEFKLIRLNKKPAFQLCRYSLTNPPLELGSIAGRFHAACHDYEEIPLFLSHLLHFQQILHK